MTAISDRPATAIRDIFGADKALIGVVHCPPFPGSPRYRGDSMASIYDACVRDAAAYIEGGLSGLIVENHGDVPFSKPEDIDARDRRLPRGRHRPHPRGDRRARSASTCSRTRRSTPSPSRRRPAPRFIRVNQWANAYVANEGFMEGRAAEAMRYRSLLRAEGVRVFADTHVKHGAHAITADRTVGRTDPRPRLLRRRRGDRHRPAHRRRRDLRRDRRQSRDATHLPSSVGSGVTPDNVAAILARTDGVIVASSLKQGGLWWNPVEVKTVAAFCAKARR